MRPDTPGQLDPSTSLRAGLVRAPVPTRSLMLGHWPTNAYRIAFRRAARFTASLGQHYHLPHHAQIVMQRANIVVRSRRHEGDAKTCVIERDRVVRS